MLSRSQASRLHRLLESLQETTDIFGYPIESYLSHLSHSARNIAKDLNEIGQEILRWERRGDRAILYSLADSAIIAVEKDIIDRSGIRAHYEELIQTLLDMLHSLEGTPGFRTLARGFERFRGAGREIKIVLDERYGDDDPVEFCRNVSESWLRASEELDHLVRGEEHGSNLLAALLQSLAGRYLRHGIRAIGIDREWPQLGPQPVDDWELMSVTGHYTGD